MGLLPLIGHVSGACAACVNSDFAEVYFKIAAV